MPTSQYHFKTKPSHKHSNTHCKITKCEVQSETHSNQNSWSRGSREEEVNGAFACVCRFIQQSICNTSCGVLSEKPLKDFLHTFVCVLQCVGFLLWQAKEKLGKECEQTLESLCRRRWATPRLGREGPFLGFPSDLCPFIFCNWIRYCPRLDLSGVPLNTRESHVQPVFPGN